MSSEQPARIVVVDDNPASLYATSRVLRGAGFEVSEGINGEQAIALALKGPDLVILDVNLPDIHGFEVCRMIRADPRTAHLPVIHVSATFVKGTDKAQGLDAGADGYLTHPVEPPVLIATVNAFLRARQAEDELRLSESKFKAVFHNALSGISLLDQNFSFLDANQAISDLLGRPRNEVIDKKMSDLLRPEVVKRLKEIEGYLEEQGAWRGILPLVRPDGSLVHLEWYISAHSFPGVRLAVVADVTERVQLESERQQLLVSERAARAEAERANRLKDEFLGTLSHELRTPLNSILLWAQVLQQNADKPEQVRTGLASIERNTKVQAQLISDLLDVSRIISGKLSLDAQPMDLCSTVRAALEVLSPAIEAKDLKIQTVLSSQAGMISGDSARLQQVVWNLVNNAIKFTPRGGKIRVSVERIESHVEVSVVDNGQGIKPELLPFLFDRFRQGDVGSNRIHGGLGLGLAIVKHLVEMHGGSVYASSMGPDQGARFVVTLPISAIHDQLRTPVPVVTEAGPSIGGPDAPLDGLKVLVVDDDVDACAVLVRILENAGASAFEASEVSMALARLEQVKPDVLVSDIGMPDRDGYELIREVRARGFSHQTLPAIALTALARPEDRRRALLAGYQLHLAKPIDASELIAAIGSLRGRTGNGSTLSTAATTTRA
jgi:PAS domain S-box-containing protein